MIGPRTAIMSARIRQNTPQQLQRLIMIPARELTSIRDWKGKLRLSEPATLGDAMRERGHWFPLDQIVLSWGARVVGTVSVVFDVPPNAIRINVPAGTELHKFVVASHAAGEADLKVQFLLDPAGQPRELNVLTGATVPDEAADIGSIVEGFETALGAEVEAPGTEIETRDRVLQSIVRRRGQPEFRRRLIEAYAGRCAISGCDAGSALEAAHVLPYAAGGGNRVENGLLLRADIHTLFDLRLIAVDPDRARVVLHPTLRATTYAKPFHGRPFVFPERVEREGLARALRGHLAATGMRLGD